MNRSSKNVQVPQEVINSRRNLSAAFGTVGNTLVYPPDMGTHYMMFRFREYSASRNNASAGTGLRTGDSRDSYTSSIVLPVPQNLSETFSANFNQEALGTLGGAALDLLSGTGNVFRGMLNGTAEGTGRMELNNFLQGFNASRAALDVGSAAVNLAARETLSREMYSAVGQATGVVLNPNLVSAFYGVNLRHHYFVWLFSPENANESRILEQASKRFKFHMLPSNTTRYFLQYPDEVDITIGGSPDYQMPFKSCVVKNVHFDYTPAGNPISKFRGTGAHTQIAFAIQLMETEAFVREDITNTGVLPTASTPRPLNETIPRGSR